MSGDIIVDHLVDRAMRNAIRNGNHGLAAWDEAIKSLIRYRSRYGQAIDRLKEGRKHYVRTRFASIADTLSRPEAEDGATEQGGDRA